MTTHYTRTLTQPCPAITNSINNLFFPNRFTIYYSLYGRERVFETDRESAFGAWKEFKEKYKNEVWWADVIIEKIV